MQAQEWKQYINGSSYRRRGTDREVMDIVGGGCENELKRTGVEDQRERTAQVITARLPSSFAPSPLAHTRTHSHTECCLYITIIKKERTLLIKSINHTGGVGSSAHPLATVSNQSSPLVMYSWEM